MRNLIQHRAVNYLCLIVLFYLLSLALNLSIASADTQTYHAVTTERLLNPEPHNWLMYRGTYDSHGYSSLEQINVDNVSELKPVWTYATGMREGHQAPPIVNDGIMFVSTPFAQVLALDTRTGDLLWRYQRELPEDLIQMHPTNRGVALHGNLVFVGTTDGYVVALDARTGDVVWEQMVEDYAKGYYITMAPLVASNKVMVGVSGGEFGIRGFVQAFDTQSGEPAWKTFTIPEPGEPGNETWGGESWKTGGVPVWITGSYDPELNLTYWGTGNGGPWMGDMRPGDNLYANSVIALDADTGELKAHHQYHWNDSWDWDEVSAPILVDYQRGEKRIKGLVHAGRNGYLWFLERAKDRIGFVDAQRYVKQNVFTSIDKKTGRPTYDMSRKPGTGKGAEFCPSPWGGKNWPPAAYSPKTGYLYIPANDNICAWMKGQEVEYRAGQPFMGVGLEEIRVFPHEDGKEYMGEIQAWDLNNPKKVWSKKFKSANWGPMLATGGNLLFSGGTYDRYFRAHHAVTGELLWQQRTNSGVIGVPVSYAVDGVQYIAVQSGWGVDAAAQHSILSPQLENPVAIPQGGVIWVFALPETTRKSDSAD